MPIETIVATFGKSDPAFDLQADIIFSGNGRAKSNKFLDYIKSIVIGCNLRINTLHGSTHTYIIGHYNPSVRIIDLVSHTIYVVCVNFIHKWRDLQFKVDSERQI